MPEGHTIHALAARLERAFRGEVVHVTSPQGRFASEAERLDASTFESAEAVGKHLFIRLGPHIVHVHLGLIGTFHVKPRGLPEVGRTGELKQPEQSKQSKQLDESPRSIPGASTVRLRIQGPTHVAELRGPMICAVIDDARKEQVVAGLGPDPLDPSADPDRAWRRIQRSRKAIADLLLEQAIVSGIGNVYRCEVLFRQRADPMTPGVELGRPLWTRIWTDLVTLLPLGVAFSQILTMQDQVDVAVRMVEDGSAEPIAVEFTGERLGDFFERRFHVYQRTAEQCDRCGRRIREAPLGGRRLYWCPGCQTRRKR